jgi:hypothetical protein
VSAARAVAAHFTLTAKRRLSKRDCAPSTDLHLCVNQNANSRLRQPVSAYSKRPSTASIKTHEGRRMTLSLTAPPPHSRRGGPQDRHRCGHRPGDSRCGKRFD